MSTKKSSIEEKKPEQQKPLDCEPDVCTVKPTPDPDPAGLDWPDPPDAKKDAPDPEAETFASGARHGDPSKLAATYVLINSMVIAARWPDKPLTQAEQAGLHQAALDFCAEVHLDVLPPWLEATLGLAAVTGLTYGQRIMAERAEKGRETDEDPTRGANMDVCRAEGQRENHPAETAAVVAYEAAA